MSSLTRWGSVEVSMVRKCQSWWGSVELNTVRICQAWHGEELSNLAWWGSVELSMVCMHLQKRTVTKTCHTWWASSHSGDTTCLVLHVGKAPTQLTRGLCVKVAVTANCVWLRCLLGNVQLVNSVSLYVTVPSFCKHVVTCTWPRILSQYYIW